MNFCLFVFVGEINKKKAELRRIGPRNNFRATDTSFCDLSPQKKEASLQKRETRASFCVQDLVCRVWYLICEKNIQQNLSPNKYSLLYV